MFPARIVNGRIQTVDEHLKQVAKYNIQNLEKCNLTNLCKIISLYHDCGKYTEEFTEYIKNATSDDENTRKKAVRGSVNHTFAGVCLNFKNHYTDDDYDILTSEIIAFVCGSHHGQFDCLNEDGKDGFEHRKNIDVELVTESFYKLSTNKNELDYLFKQAVDEVKNIVAIIKTMLCSVGKSDKSNCRYFYFSLLCRLLLSSLVDADRRDAMEFHYNIKVHKPDIGYIWEENLKSIERKLDALEIKSEIDVVRRDISNQAKNFETPENGIYKLSIPTGSGKTLVSLRWAVSHANRYKKSRILFVIPLLSILEQNAEVIKKYITDCNILTEHHSNIIKENKNTDSLNMKELLIETWDSPIVITTLFQLLNTMFDGKNSNIRRLNSLVDSIIVIDEVQQVPKNMLTIFNLTINFLQNVCGATIVFCSATQPSFEQSNKPVMFSENCEIVPPSDYIENHFKRTKITAIDGTMDLYQVEQFVSHQDMESILVICNKKEQASILHKKISSYKENVFHLSTSMCMNHRKDIIKKVNENLKNKIPTICVSTQLVEAGVDFSFECVIRFMAGIDNIIQSAGRCNRHGEYKRLCPVYVINVDENLSKLNEIQEAKNATYSLLIDKTLEIDSKETVKRYYDTLFKNMRKSQDYAVDGTTLFDLLSRNLSNPTRPEDSKLILRQSFKRAGELFKVFDNETTDIIVPYKESEDLICELLSDKAKYDFNKRKQVISKLNGYSVSVYEYSIKNLINKGAIQELFEGSIRVLSKDFYNEHRGIEENLGFLEA